MDFTPINSKPARKRRRGRRDALESLSTLKASLPCRSEDGVPQDLQSLPSAEAGLAIGSCNLESDPSSRDDQVMSRRRRSSANPATAQDKSSAKAKTRPAKPKGRKAGRKKSPSTREKAESRAMKAAIRSLAPKGVSLIPSQSYLDQARGLPTSSISQKPLLIVLDLNGALIHRPSRAGAATFICRPHVMPFLDYCLSKHYVLIWSSARPENVRRIVDQLVPNQWTAELRENRPERRLLGIWGRDTLGLSPEEYHKKIQVYKRLETVWSDEAINVPPSAEDLIPPPRWDQTNTVLVDDSSIKGSAQPHNLIQVSEFVGGPEDGDESVLWRVMLYLEELSKQNDVSAFMRIEPFSYPPLAKATIPETI